MFNVQLQVFFGYLENWLYLISMIFKYLCHECNIYMVNYKLSIRKEINAFIINFIKSINLQ